MDNRMTETKNKNKNKRRLSFTLSLFPTNNSFQTFPKIKSPKIFEDSNGVVGLGIVAAMHDGSPKHPLLSKNKSAILAISPKSPNPVPILSSRKNPSFEKMEMSEEYTCVISHVGKNLVKKREYFDGDLLGVTEATVGGHTNANNGDWISLDLVDNYFFTVGQNSQIASNGWTVDFLNSCFLCKKKLHGLDIFMYRGETAFCSAECRYKQISVDEHEKCGSSLVMNPTDSFQCFSGVTAT